MYIYIYGIIRSKRLLHGLSLEFGTGIQLKKHTRIVVSLKSKADEGAQHDQSRENSGR